MYELSILMIALMGNKLCNLSIETYVYERLGGAFLSSSLGVFVDGYSTVEAYLLPFVPLSRRLCWREGVDNPCGGGFVLRYFPYCQGAESQNVWKVPTRWVKVGCKRGALKCPTVIIYR
ncbi:hypothetical protein LR48_Vigan08g072500 [Vigna angularis]|uniref:Uncharacterized protein n=1 Tax=Phaseolus angularis TaxID=3914 RepID=A0A0L9V4G9_PHAAN|nr:hypothetical protein LR48_Vigan08g072500 [Vigna angularis]